MRFPGGYNVPLAGRPAGRVEALPEPEALDIPLAAGRLAFRDIRIADGQEVRQGQVLAVDPAHFGAPLLSPRGGTARIGPGGNLIRLENLVVEEEEPATEATVAAPSAPAGPVDQRRRELVELGAWQFFRDARDGQVPDPSVSPQAVIVSTVRLEPFSLRGDAQLARRLSAFARGLEHIQGLLEYQPIWLVVPRVHSGLAAKVRQLTRGHARLSVVTVPLRYPHDDCGLLARRLRLRPAAGPVWGVHVEGVLAVDRAMTFSRPCTVRVVAVGGPGVQRPVHVRAMAGYPVGEILRHCGVRPQVRVIRGGALTGSVWPEGQTGLDAECSALTVVPEASERRLLGFARPGLDEPSFTRCYLSRFRRPFGERMTAELRGERRACVACGYCQDVCPAGIWPHLIHKHLYQNDLDGAQRARIDLCILCGLCAYVCPSKIDLLEQFRQARKAIRDELATQQAEESERAGQARQAGRATGGDRPAGGDPAGEGGA